MAQMVVRDFRWQEDRRFSFHIENANKFSFTNDEIPELQSDT